jgi:hypothetical protein
VRAKLYGKHRMGEVIRVRAKLYGTVSQGWERLSGVRAKMYGKHKMLEVIKSEGKAVR